MCKIMKISSLFGNGKKKSSKQARLRNIKTRVKTLLNKYEDWLPNIQLQYSHLDYVKC